MSATLGDVCSFLNGGTPSRSVARYFEGDIPWITGADINGPIVNEARSFITDEAISESATNLVPAGTILLVTRTSVGKVAIAGTPLCFSQDITAITPDPKRVDAGYLVHLLRTKQSYFERLARGATIKGVTRDAVAAIRVQLPPLPEQRRVAEILDKADALRAKRRASIAQLDALTQSIFLDMFGDPVTNPKGWPESAILGDVADIVSGVTIGRKLDGKSTRSVPYLAVVNVQDGYLDLSATKATEATAEEIQRYYLVKDDLLLTEGGDPDKLGRGTLWNSELPECIHQNHVFRVRLFTTELTPLFLNWLVGSQRGKRFFLRSAKQTTGIASINMTQLRSFPLIVPPAPLQAEFARRLAEVEPMKSDVRRSIVEFDALFDSLQHRAFRGEL